MATRLSDAAARAASASCSAPATPRRSARSTCSTSCSWSTRSWCSRSHPVMAHLAEVHEAALAPLVRAGVAADRPRRRRGGRATSPTTPAWTRSTSRAPTGRTRRSCTARAPRARTASAATTRSCTSRSPPSSATSRRSSSCRAAGARRDLDYHAENIATMLTNNAGFNCTTSRVIVTAAGWPQRAALMDRIRRRLAATPPRLAYYPGARERFAAFARGAPGGGAVRRRRATATCRGC